MVFCTIDYVVVGMTIYCHNDLLFLLLTPLKINMEHNHGGLEDYVPFEMGDL